MGLLSIITASGIGAMCFLKHNREGGTALAEPPTSMKPSRKISSHSKPILGLPSDLHVMQPPVVLLGGEANALSVARDLKRMGVKVYAIGSDDSCVRASRTCEWLDVPTNGKDADSWAAYLLGPASDHLRGAVVLSCSDAGLQVLIRHREALQRRFKLDLCNPVAQAAMLDKLTTYEHALQAGVPTPKFWKVTNSEQIEQLKQSLVYPLLIKPRLSHLFEKKFGKKFLVAHSYDEVAKAFEVARGAGMEALLMEMIPGPDSCLSSYFTYVDEEGRPLVHFTKRVVRRYQPGMGSACYHLTDEVPDIRELSEKLYRQAGLRGLVNVEFKYDARDGQYKLIECNARFVASNRLVSASGVNLAALVYNRIIGRPYEAPTSFKSGMRLRDPLRDFAAFLELRRQGEIGVLEWLASIMHRQSFPYFAWSDPGPSLSRLFKPLRRVLRGKN
jgi:D-aspartate ligase